MLRDIVSPIDESGASILRCTSRPAEAEKGKKKRNFVELASNRTEKKHEAKGESKEEEWWIVPSRNVLTPRKGSSFSADTRESPRKNDWRLGSKAASVRKQVMKKAQSRTPTGVYSNGVMSYWSPCGRKTSSVITEQLYDCPSGKITRVIVPNGFVCPAVSWA